MNCELHEVWEKTSVVCYRVTYGNSPDKLFENFVTVIELGSSLHQARGKLDLDFIHILFTSSESCSRICNSPLVSHTGTGLQNDLLLSRLTTTILYALLVWSSREISVSLF